MFEIGNSLREARLRQQLQFSVLEERTKVRPKYLRALEDEEFDVLPAPTYVKGFLKAYADALGLDGQLYVDEFNSRFVVGEEEAPFRPKRNPSTRAARRVETSAVLIAVVAIGLVTGLLIVAFTFGGNSPKPRPLDVPRQAAVAAAHAPARAQGGEAAHRRGAHRDPRGHRPRGPLAVDRRADPLRGHAPAGEDASASSAGASGSARARRRTSTPR